MGLHRLSGYCQCILESGDQYCLYRRSYRRVIILCIARFELIPIVGITALFFEIMASVGGAVVIGLMVFGFLGRKMGLLAAAIALLFMLIFATGFLRQYMVLVASLTAYGVSTIVCVIVSLMGNERFDFDLIAQRVGSYDKSLKLTRNRHQTLKGADNG